MTAQLDSALGDLISQSTNVSMKELAHNLMKRAFREYGKFLETFRDEDIQQAASTMHLALRAHGRIGHDAVGLREAVGCVITYRDFRCGQLSDIEDGIKHACQVVGRVSKDDRQKAKRLINLRDYLKNRFDRLWQIDDLDEVIHLTRQVIKLVGDDSSKKSNQSRMLRDSLYWRFKRLGHLTDLDEAVHLARQLTGRTADGDQSDLFNLGLVLSGRFGRTGELSDLAEAIDLYEKVIDSTPEDSSSISTPLVNLSNALKSRYERLGQLADINRAVDLARQAVRLAGSSSDKARLSSNLGAHLATRFQRVGDMVDLEEAINSARDAIILEHDDKSGTAIHLGNLAMDLFIRFQRLGQLSDLEESITMFRISSSSVHLNPYLRVSFGFHLLKILKTQRRYKEARDETIRLLDLVRLVNTRGLSQEDQLYAAARFVQLASDACALQLHCSNENENARIDALSALESGRGAMIGLALEDRTDSVDLRTRHPDLAERFLRLREAISKRDDIDERDLRDSSQHTVIPMFEIRQLFKQCLTDIRSLPGHQDFLRPPSIKDMMAAAIDTTIVYVNANEIRSDAIIVTQSDVRTLRLEHLDYNTANNFATRKAEALTFVDSQECGKKNRKLIRFLRWLWQSCVEPILGTLGLLTPSKQLKELQRIHWIGVGAASTFPFHAAGDHVAAMMTPTHATAMDLVASSYIPSIRSLIHVQRKRHTSMSTSQQLFLATMATTPNESDLENVSVEATEVESCVGGQLKLSKHAQLDAKSVLKALETHNFFHYAGHGRSDSVNAARNSIILERYESSLQQTVQDALSIEQLFKINIPNAELAFLSACSTADNQVHELADEGLHLASGFLVGGFRSVVASQWPVQDRVCVEIAKGFYQKLGLHSQKVIRPGEVSRALYTAVQSVRSSRLDKPILWAPYIHLGA